MKNGDFGIRLVYQRVSYILWIVVGIHALISINLQDIVGLS